MFFAHSPTFDSVGQVRYSAQVIEESDDMKEVILKKLSEIETAENVRILLAAEAGSRAWGLDSKESDYDVRFIYVRPQEEYLRLEKASDVIERPIRSRLDMSGWDLQKALRLLYRSNPTIFEWLSSHIMYIHTESANDLRTLALDYFSVKRSVYHYLNMANRIDLEYLQKEIIPVKKYFYALRSVMACRWILEKGTPPPVLFADLMEAELPDSVRGEVESLLAIKTRTEIRKIRQIESLNAYIDKEFAIIRNSVKDIKEEERHDWEPLNEYFLKVLKKNE